MPLCIAHTVASIADANAGPTYSVTALCEALAAGNNDIKLHTVKGWRFDVTHAKSTVRASIGVSIISHSQDFRVLPIARGFCFSGELDTALWREAGVVDVFHTHGLWLMPNIYPARVARGQGKPFMISPRGMLGPAALEFSKWKKRVLWYTLQRHALETASCIHTTSKAEHDEVRTMGLTNPIAIIPNGVNLSPLSATANATADPTRTVLSLGRIHPKKGLDRLVEAWAKVETEHPDWRLQIVGPDEGGHVAELEALAARLQLRRISIQGPLNGAEKSMKFQSADIFVLPSLNENFGLTVVESLAAGTPVISSKGAPWAGLIDHKCGWWIDHGAEALAKTLGEAMSLPDKTRGEMGARGRNWMERDFSWDKIARDMADVYNWLVNGGDRPNTVHTD